MAEILREPKKNYRYILHESILYKKMHFTDLFYPFSIFSI